MADLTYVLYDTAAFGATAGTEHVLFQVTQGADSTHVEAFTNMRGNGSLPQEEAFEISLIGVMADFDMTEAEVAEVFRASFLEIRVSDETVLKAPLSCFAYRNSYGGAYSQGTAADNAIIGLAGDGFVLTIPVQIRGGTSFRIRVYQGTAMSGASKNVKVMLFGRLTRP